MDVLVIAGFLGSGKTSLILSLAKPLQRIYGSVAIVENEVGRIPLDGRVLQETGLELREIFSGCICCSLQQDLRLTLRQLRDGVNPRLVVIEPSGIAAPGVVRDALVGDDAIDEVRVLTMVDAARLGRAFTLDTPFVSGGIAAADMVFLNKCDTLDSAVCETVVKEVHERCPMIPLVSGSSYDAATVRELASQLQVLPDGTMRESTPGALVGGVHPAVCARAFELSSADPQDARRRVAALLTAIAADLAAAGCELLGHAKLALAAQGQTLRASLTDLSGVPQIEGMLQSGSDMACGGINVIALGVGKDALVASVDARLAEYATPLPHA